MAGTRARTTRAALADIGVVVFARVDDPDGAGRSELCTQFPLDAAAVLCSWNVRLVCVSASGAPYVRQVQRQLGIEEPFVCQGGAALHVPSRYLHSADNRDARADGAWEIFKFNPPDRTAAVNLVRDVFVARGWDDPVTVGIGCDCDDYGVLAVVDLPIVVRDAINDQSVLLRYVPGAYVTRASGPAGWCEALIGRD